jgi:hypothetical protein
MHLAPHIRVMRIPIRIKRMVQIPIRTLLTLFVESDFDAPGTLYLGDADSDPH